MLIVDAVSTFGANEFLVDEWKIDVAFSGSQRALGAPPGLAPITFGPRAVEKIENRKTPPPVYYYDATLINSLWNCRDGPRL